MTLGRVAAATALAAASWYVIGGSVALADPAGPTDYRSEIVEIVPDADGISVSIIGGDSFVRLAADPGVEVIVIGYQGEPYLRFHRDGTVEANLSSPATYYNEERYGGDIPDSVEADATPRWDTRGSGGTYAWHDHRAHRMEEFAPLNVERGDVVLDGVVPIVVDGVDVEIRVSSRWMPAPSPAPTVAGLALGGVLGAAVMAFGVRRRSTGVVLLVVGAAATAIGVAGFTALPAETGRELVWWAAPAIAVLCGLAAVVLRDAVAVSAAVALGGVMLVMWAWLRREGWGRAILPTDAPYWADRMVSATALVVGAAMAVAGLIALLRATGVPIPAWLSDPRGRSAKPLPHPR